MKYHQISSGIAFALALGFAAPALAQEAVQLRVEDGGNGHWYRAIRFGESNEQGIGWFTAAEVAVGKGGYLATPATQPENDWIRQNILPQLSLMPGEFGPWLGGVFQDGQWTWITGETWSFSAWGGGEPSNPPMENRLHYWRATCCLWWNDASSITQVSSAVVEWSADCNGDGIVDYGQCRDGSLPDYDGDNVPDCCEAGTPCVAGRYPRQWRKDDGGNGHWYIVETPGDITWTDSRARAESVGGYLGCAETNLERAYFFGEFGFARIPFACSPENGNPNTQYGPWIGGYQEPGSPEPIGGWRWVSGAFFDPTEAECCNNYGCPGAEGFLHLYWRSDIGQTWNDLANVTAPCSSPISYLVEWSADCNADGIVDYGQILQGQLVDADSNGVPDICEVDPCPGDVVESGSVNGIDLAAILANWGTDGGKFPRTDANGDGTVDAGDLSIVLAGWGPCP